MTLRGPVLALVLGAIAGCVHAQPNAAPPRAFAVAVAPSPASAPPPPVGPLPTLPTLPTPAPVASPAPAVRPLQSPEQRITLPVPGYGEAAVTLPLGTTTRRPIVVGLHGHRSRHDWQCRSVRDVFGRSAFGVCPQGIPAPASPGDEEERYTFGPAAAVGKEIAAAIAAVVRAFPDYVDAERPLVFGHSTGAYVAAALVASDRARWSHAILNEGGAGLLAVPGGPRVVYACGTPECNAAGAGAARARPNARVVYAAGAGHKAYGPILDLLRDELPWLVADDPRFTP